MSEQQIKIRLSVLLIIILLVIASGLFGCGAAGEYRSPTDEPDGDRFELVWSRQVGGESRFIVTDDHQYYAIELARTINVMNVRDIDLDVQPKRPGSYYPGYIEFETKKGKIPFDFKLIVNPKESLHAARSSARDITN